MLGVLLATAASALMMRGAHAADVSQFDTDAVLMAPVSDHSITTTQIAPQRTEMDRDFPLEIQVAQAAPDSAVAKSNQMAPAAIPTAPPYTKTTTRKPVATPQPAAKPVEAKQSPVDYVADAVDYNQDAKIVTLKGRVELTQDGRTLGSDTVTYNLKDDIAVAEGNVVITDPNGDVHHATSVELSDKMRKGLVNELFTEMADGSRVWADKGVKSSETRYKLTDAEYTACKACEKDPTKRPPWRLHAKEVELRKDEHRVVYKNAWLDLGGVPVLYTPYFSHPDGSIKQKSGFLTPSFGYNSELGAFYSQPYYWAISPDTDTTFWLMPTTKESPLLRNQFRKRFGNAYVETDASVTNSSRTDSIGGVDVRRGSELRGHFFGNAGWDINDKWRARADIELASDQQYLRQYGFGDDSFLENQLYAERFDNRDYAIVKALAFQDLRTTKTDQPNILPLAEMSMLGDANALMGGRWQWDSSVLSLARDGNGQDVWRGSTRASWERQDILPVGAVIKSEVGARADVYATTNRLAHALNPAVSESNQQGRFFPNAQLTASYPMKSDFKDFQLRVEPVTTVYLSPDINNNNSIPNEDSLDVQLDAGNLLEGNRFPGLDRIEDSSHIAYGLKTGLYSYEGGRVSTFLGQSYNFDDTGNPFPNGSGLESRSSDYVGSVNASFGDGMHDLSYRFQVDSDTLASQRHELYAQTGYGPVEVDGYYLYAQGEPGTDYPDSREQIRLGSSIQLTDVWTVRGDVIYDLSDVKTERGLRRSIFTLNYSHECYTVAMTADRYLADASSGVQDTTVMFRIGLKNLGEYQTDAFDLGKGRGDE